MAFTPDGKRLAYGACGLGLTASAVVLDWPSRQPAATQKHLTVMTDHVHGIDGVVTPDGRTVIYSENDPLRKIALWNFRDGDKVRFSPELREAVTLASSLRSCEAVPLPSRTSARSVAPLPHR